MTDLTKLKELAEPCSMCGGKGYYCEFSTLETCWCVEPATKSDEVSELRAEVDKLKRLIAERWKPEVERLRNRLEIDERTPYDGIACRDETIKGLDEKCDRLKAENAALRKQLEQVHPFKFAGPLEGPDLKCAACGGYHYGLPAGMPCPKSAAVAIDAALEGGGR